MAAAPTSASAPPVFDRLLLTGAAGGLGRVLRPRLKRLCRVLRASDIAAMDPAGDGEEVMVAPLEDSGAMHALVEGVAAIVHLTLTDDHPWAQAFVVIEARPITEDTE